MLPRIHALALWGFWKALKNNVLDLENLQDFQVGNHGGR